MKRLLLLVFVLTSLSSYAGSIINNKNGDSIYFYKQQDTVSVDIKANEDSDRIYTVVEFEKILSTMGECSSGGMAPFEITKMAIETAQIYGGKEYVGILPSLMMDTILLPATGGDYLISCMVHKTDIRKINKVLESDEVIYVSKRRFERLRFYLKK